MPTEITSHIHPIIVHFPIALILIGTLYDLLVAWRDSRITGRKSLLLWVVALIGAWVAVWTGPEGDARGNTDSIHLHSTLADLTAIAVTLLVVVRILRHLQERDFNRGTLTLYLLLSIVCSLLVLSTGYYGGKMVYDDGVGVSVNGKPVSPPQAHHFNKQE